jgi:hypothetical protein
MLFNNFPSTLFKLTDDSSVVVTDFIRAIKLDPQLKDNSLLYTLYEASDGETPEVISHKFYKSTEYHWVIMLVNEKFDPWRDFPQTDNVVIAGAKEKYSDINAIHHYEDSNHNVVDEFYPLSTPITNIDHERRVNESKRTVKVLKKQVLSDFVDQYRSLISR